MAYVFCHELHVSFEKQCALRDEFRQVLCVVEQLYTIDSRSLQYSSGILVVAVESVQRNERPYSKWFVLQIACVFTRERDDVGVGVNMARQASVVRQRMLELRLCHSEPCGTSARSRSVHIHRQKIINYRWGRVRIPATTIRKTDRQQQQEHPV